MEEQLHLSNKDTMPRRHAFGRADEATHPDSMRAALAEFVSTFVFVFDGEGSVLALGTGYNAYIVKYYPSPSPASVYIHFQSLVLLYAFNHFFL